MLTYPNQQKNDCITAGGIAKSVFNSSIFANRPFKYRYFLGFDIL
jgi:hypothetical protein